MSSIQSSSSSSSSSSYWASPRASLISVCFGVTGSACSKYGLNDDWTNYFVQQASTHLLPFLPSSPSHEVVTRNEWMLFWFFRVIFIIGQLVFNSFQLKYFIHSMHLSNSLLASTYNQCFSIIVAGLLGYVAFAEQIQTTWLIGVAFIMVGVVYVQLGNSDDTESEKQSGELETIDKKKSKKIN